MQAYTARSSALYLVLILVALMSPSGIPVGATFFIISAGSLSGDIAAYKTASYFEKTFPEKLCKYDRVLNYWNIVVGCIICIIQVEEVSRLKFILVNL